MKTNYLKALALVLQVEKGFVDNPRDRGGPTNKGVTQAVYNAYRARKGLQLQSVKLIADSEVSDIYKSEYWDAVNGDNLPNGVDYEVFDFGVNSGVHRAAVMLQAILGVSQDGAIGPATIAAARLNPATTIHKLEGARLAFQQRLATWGTFGRGWQSRDVAVESAAEAMA
jgi:lysozyme family protein